MKSIQVDTKDFYEWHQSRPIRNVTSVKHAIFTLYKGNTLQYLNLSFNEVISNRNMQTFKESSTFIMVKYTMPVQSNHCVSYTVTAYLSVSHPFPMTAQDGPVFIQTEAFN